jgi:hypothetical protein
MEDLFRSLELNIFLFTVHHHSIYLSAVGGNRAYEFRRKNDRRPYYQKLENCLNPLMSLYSILTLR